MDSLLSTIYLGYLSKFLLSADGGVKIQSFRLRVKTERYSLNLDLGEGK
jgi:hypothetical protein